VGLEGEPGEVDVHAGGAVAPAVEPVRPWRQQRQAGLVAVPVVGDTLRDIGQFLPGDP
jgi:hypothetical protein